MNLSTYSHPKIMNVAMEKEINPHNFKMRDLFLKTNSFLKNFKTNSPTLSKNINILSLYAKAKQKIEIHKNIALIRSFIFLSSKIIFTHYSSEKLFITSFIFTMTE